MSHQYKMILHMIRSSLANIIQRMKIMLSEHHDITFNESKRVIFIIKTIEFFIEIIAQMTNGEGPNGS